MDAFDDDDDDVKPVIEPAKAVVKAEVRGGSGAAAPKAKAGSEKLKPAVKAVGNAAVKPERPSVKAEARAGVSPASASRSENVAAGARSAQAEMLAMTQRMEQRRANKVTRLQARKY